jgi:hypothetical protein
MSKKLYSEEQMRQSFREGQQWVHDLNNDTEPLQNFNEFLATLTPEPSSNLIDRKQVEDILKEHLSNIEMDIDWFSTGKRSGKYKDKLDEFRILKTQIEVIAAQVSSLPSVSTGEGKGWISVEDRLPENGKYHVFSTDYHYVSDAWYDNRREGSYWIDSKENPMPFITHWMPLPSPTCNTE